MDLDLFLSPADAARATSTLCGLARHNISRFSLTGGFAIETQVLVHGGQPRLRPLRDIDFLVDAFNHVPSSMGRDLLLRHVHPDDSPGKILLQAVDPATSVRIDVFREFGNEMARSQPGELAGIPIRILSFEDLAARHARLCWDLIDGKQLAPKYARDFLRLLEIVALGQGFAAPNQIDAIWQEHRKPSSPATFAEAAQQIRRVVEERHDLLIPPAYSTEVNENCTRCHATPTFPLAPPAEILAHLGYC